MARPAAGLTDMRFDSSRARPWADHRSWRRCATLRPVNANTPGEIAVIIGGAIELDETPVLWLAESGTNAGLLTSLLATKIAHCLHAGLYPDDTFSGWALILSEAPGLHGELISTDVTAERMDAIAGANGVVAVGLARSSVLMDRGTA